MTVINFGFNAKIVIWFWRSKGRKEKTSKMKICKRYWRAKIFVIYNEISFWNIFEVDRDIHNNMKPSEVGISAHLLSSKEDENVFPENTEFVCRTKHAVWITAVRLIVVLLSARSNNIFSLPFSTENVVAVMLLRCFLLETWKSGICGTFHFLRWWFLSCNWHFLDNWTQPCRSGFICLGGGGGGGGYSPKFSDGDNPLSTGETYPLPTQGGVWERRGRKWREEAAAKWKGNYGGIVGMKELYEWKAKTEMEKCFWWWEWGTQDDGNYVCKCAGKVWKGSFSLLLSPRPAPFRGFNKHSESFLFSLFPFFLAIFCYKSLVLA